MLFSKKKKVTHYNISSDTSNEEVKVNSERRIINEKTSFEIIEAYKAARTNIMFALNNEKGCKKVIITSPTSGEGKTTSCINIASTFAETGAKVLMVDSDLRAPRIHKYMKLQNDKGLSNILAGFNKVDDCIFHCAQANLDCITSGAIPPNPVELLSSDTMKDFLGEIESKYDYIFIDTPPLNIVTEALLLSKLATGVIIVTRQKYTMYKMVERAISSLKFANAKILGFVLNDADDDGYAYGGYRAKSSYRYGSRKNKFVRYGYFGENVDQEKPDGEKVD